MLRTRTTTGAGAVVDGPLPWSLLAASAVVAALIEPSLLCGLAALAVLVIGGLTRLRRGAPWTPADAVTATRLGLAVVCVSLLLTDGPGLSWSAVAVGSAALALDALDGYIARRTRATEAGAAFDETVDALFVLLFSLALVPLWGVWTVLPGLYYYVFTAITAVRTQWQQKLPYSRMRKVVAAAQGILLIAAGSPPAQAHPWFGFACAGAAVTALSWSFGRDIVWLERHHSAVHDAAGPGRRP